ncbi:ParA family protein [Ruegeria sp. 6PALISEP08]|uniref:ParA family protein n=1 Tax=Ruegeria sp. 6PALISEP08 TaxID=1225660 RepID=UPI00067F72F8|nr:AAA family ATPase [Ruegeria sp. 6PALISEP08]
MFNHKGGTGKTVSAYNIGWKLTQHGHNVLLVDGDSQVNLTALALGYDRFDAYYDDPSTKLNNIKDGVAPVFEGRPQALEAFECPLAENNDKLFVLPGHADLAAYEGQLSLAQETSGSLSVLKNLPGAIHALIGLVEEKYGIDYTIIDLNPGLGALNQNFFMGCDGFVVPTNPDPFSLMAVETLGTHLTKWHDWKIANIEKFADAGYPLRDSMPVFMGTINARFNKHASKAAKKFDDRIKKIDQSVTENLVPKLAASGMVASKECYEEAHEKWKHVLTNDNTGLYALGRVPDFQGLIHTATVSGVPIFALDEDKLKSDGIQGVILEKALPNINQFDEIFEAITAKIELLISDDCRET